MSRELINSWTRNDFDIQWFSGTGAGGQHRNKHQNCVRITHIESGLTETGQNHRNRVANFREAFQRLADRLAEEYHGKETKPRAPVTETVRTYNVVDNRVIDHASGKKSPWSTYDVDEMIRARKAAVGDVDEP